MAMENGTTKQRQVFIKVSFIKIEEIDTIKETFKADVFIQARWREPSLDHSKGNAEINWNAYWNPKIRVQNTVSVQKHNTWCMIQADDSGETYVLEKHRMKGVFAESLELALFPFDIQDLTLFVTTDLSEADLDLLEESREVSSVHLETFVKEQEWDLHECVEFTKTATTKEYANTKFKNPALLVNCCAGRKPGFFLWNVLLVMTLISSLSLATFSLDRSKQPNRLQLSFMLILTSVTFKFVTNQIIPKISYLTHLDRYIICSMVFLYLVAMWHACLTLITDDETASDCDHVAFYVLLGVFFALQIGFAVTIVITRYNRYRHVKDAEALYKVKTENIKGMGQIVRHSKSKAIFRRKTTKINMFG